jgi:hypothetical protein
MGVVNNLSAELTALQASPPTVADGRHAHGRLRIKSGVVLMEAADDNTSTYRVCRVKSGDSIKSIKVYTPGIAGTTDIDVGLYTINGGDAVDADIYEDGMTLATACPVVPPTSTAPDGLECRFGDATDSLPININNKVWQDLNLTADPVLEYDLVLTANAAASAAGSVAVAVTYTAGD